VLQQLHYIREASIGASRITGITSLGVNLTLLMEILAKPITPARDVRTLPHDMQRRGLSEEIKVITSPPFILFGGRICIHIGCYHDV
jgi:hypothetical protein